MLHGQLDRQTDSALTREWVTLMGHQASLWVGSEIWEAVVIAGRGVTGTRLKITESPRDPTDVKGSVRKRGGEAVCNSKKVDPRLNQSRDSLHFPEVLPSSPYLPISTLPPR